MSDITRDDINKLDSKVTDLTTAVASMSATMDGNNARIDRLVDTLQGRNGHPGLAQTVSSNVTRLNGHDDEFKTRRDSLWKTIMLCVPIATVLATVAMWIITHFSQAH